LRIDLPEDYPFKPPKKVTFETKIYHPNVSSKGDYHPCCSNYNLLGNQWSPGYGVVNCKRTIIKERYNERIVLKQLQGHLIAPSTSCCANGEALKVYLEDRTRYEAIAKDWTLRHAL
jgi:ubiquitin-conjugating enzyme E2 D/E